MNYQPHLQTNKKVPEIILMPGDPTRVEKIGKYLKNFKIISTNREFKLAKGKYKNQRIGICSTGIGCPSTAITAEELINLGAKYLIRVGTCGGGWRKDIPLGSLIIPTASIRDEGTTKEYIEKEFPAVADIKIINALTNSAKKLKTKYFTGINRTHDAFYANSDSILKWGKYLKDKKYQDTPILSSEMESSSLFIIASLRNVKAGAIFAVNANPEPLKERLKNKKLKVEAEINQEKTKKIVNEMIKVALEATTVL